MASRKAILAIASSVASLSFIAAAFAALTATLYFDESFERSPKVYQYDYMPTEYIPEEQNFYI
jgi:hypothetical protein